MTKILIILFLTLGVMADTFKVDNSSSNIHFAIVKFFFLDIEGEFTKFNGNIVLDEKNNILSINGTVDALSADMGDIDRDSDLMQEGYLDSLKYNYIDFKAISISKREIEATVSIKGISKKVIFHVDTLDVSESKVILSISSILKREDFMLNGFLSSLTSNEITVVSTLVAYK